MSLETAGIGVRSCEGGPFTEFYLTACPGEPAWPARRLFKELASVMAAKNIIPIQEMIYGTARMRGRVLSARRGAYRAGGLDPFAPTTYVEESPVHAGEIAGVRIWGVRAKSRGRTAVQSVECAGDIRGRLWRGKGFRVLYLSEVLGDISNGKMPLGAARQAERMFANVRAALRLQGFAFSDVARTWIYLRRLLSWYDDFNGVRNALYNDNGFYGARASFFPASTGIQGSVRGAECAMDVLAVDAHKGSGVGFAPVLRSARQGQAYSYRSAFSRGMVVRRGKRRTLHVSGTASIDGAGKSVYIGDPEGQSLQTLLSVAAILSEYGASLKDIASATLYCKDKRAYDAYRRVARMLCVPDFPVVPVIADVCRPELLIELEAVAVI